MTGPPPPEEIADPAVLKAVSHPLRRRMLEALSDGGAATATQLAKALGENTGATSYHLRELAKHGFVEDVPELAHGKERWWRTRPRDIRWPRRSEQSDEMRAVFDELTQRSFVEDLEQLARFQRRRDDMGEWADALVFSRGTVQLTIEELKTFWEDYLALLKRHWRPSEELPPGTRKIAVRWMAFPDPDGETAEEEEGTE